MTNITEKELEDIRENLPKDWVSQFLKICDEQMGRRYTRQNAYKILKNGDAKHDCWPVIMAIYEKWKSSQNNIKITA